jgi:WD40 repeat protein
MEPAISLALGVDGKILASGHLDGSVVLWDTETGKLTGYCFDESGSWSDGVKYKAVDSGGRTVVYTLPCGTPIPPGSQCICNCVPGAAPMPLPANSFRVPQGITTIPFPSAPRGTRGTSGGSRCSCNLVCTCVPVFR